MKHVKSYQKDLSIFSRVKMFNKTTDLNIMVFIKTRLLMLEEMMSIIRDEIGMDHVSLAGEMTSSAMIVAGATLKVLGDSHLNHR